MYTWGSSKFGQCGHGDRFSPKYPMLIKHELNKGIVDIACGSHHTLALTRKLLPFSY